MRTAKFDRIVVKEFSGNCFSASPVIEATAAFMDSSTGRTHGKTTQTHWSPETLARFAAFRESMEADLDRIHFVDEPSGVVLPSAQAPTYVVPEGGGIGEHVGGETQI